jgi:hypothetical protein
MDAKDKNSKTEEYFSPNTVTRLNQGRDRWVAQNTDQEMHTEIWLKYWGLEKQDTTSLAICAYQRPINLFKLHGICADIAHAPS